MIGSISTVLLKLKANSRRGEALCSLYYYKATSRAVHVSPELSGNQSQPVLPVAMGESKKTMEPSRGAAAKNTKDVNSAKNMGEEQAGSKKDNGEP